MPQIDQASDITLEELAAMGVGPAVDSPASVPNDLQGKSVEELAALVAGTREALRISESARTTTPVAPTSPQPTAPLTVNFDTDEIPTYTEDQLQQLQDANPMAFTALMADLAAKKAVKAFAGRIQPLINGSVTSAESGARARHAEEFELFGDQINHFASSLPDKSALTQPNAWDDLVAYVRGRPENFKKLVDAQVQKALAAAGAPSRDDAQRAARDAAPPVLPTVNVGAGPAASHGLDATGIEICRVAGLDPKEYKRWFTPNL